MEGHVWRRRSHLRDRWHDFSAPLMQRTLEKALENGLAELEETAERRHRL